MNEWDRYAMVLSLQDYIVRNIRALTLSQLSRVAMVVNECVLELAGAVPERSSGGEAEGSQQP